VSAAGLVTGASSGIGLELAGCLAADGHDVVLVARRRDRLEDVGRELARRYGVRWWAIAADLAHPAAPGEIVRQLQSFGVSVDLLVNNAGFGALGPLATLDPETLGRMLEVNVVALTRLTRLLLPGMLERRSGRILNVASTAGFVPGPLMAVYYASKAYVISLSEALAEELRGSGVTVTVLCPGPTRTEFQEVAGMGATRLFKMPGVMDAAAVAQRGYAGLKAGRRIVIPGPLNRALPFAIRFAPRTLVARVAKIFQERVR